MIPQMAMATTIYFSPHPLEVVTLEVGRRWPLPQCWLEMSFQSRCFRLVTWHFHTKVGNTYCFFYIFLLPFICFSLWEKIIICMHHNTFFYLYFILQHDTGVELNSLYIYSNPDNLNIRCHILESWHIYNYTHICNNNYVIIPSTINTIFISML